MFLKGSNYIYIYDQKYKNQLRMIEKWESTTCNSNDEANIDTWPDSEISFKAQSKATYWFTKSNCRSLLSRR